MDIDLAALLALVLVALMAAAVGVVEAIRSEGTLRRVALGTASAVLLVLAVLAALVAYLRWDLAHITF